MLTVSNIAKRAGMSSALAHHHLGGKDQIFLAAMCYILGIYVTELHAALRRAEGPRARLQAVIAALQANCTEVRSENRDAA